MSFHCEIFQLGIVPPNPLVPLMNSLSEFHQFVSYLSIKSPKSLKNKDFTTKSLFLKDLGEIDPEVFDSKIIHLTRVEEVGDDSVAAF